jgi:hypothetical protein
MRLRQTIRPLVVLLVLVWPAFATVNTAPDLTIINQKWFANTSGLSPAGPCFHSQNDVVPEITKSLNRRCPYAEARPNNDSEQTLQESNHNGASNTQFQLEYVYQLRVRNGGDRIVKAIVWEYVFSDPYSGKELTRHTFSNEVNLLPGRTKTLTANSLKPPSRVITAQMLTNNVTGNYDEKVRIRHITYNDGTEWQAQ